jgi:sortase A
LAIPVIGLNSSIVEIFPNEIVSSNGEVKSEWEPVADAVGHYSTSGNPMGGRNIVLSGHNNTLGEVFRDLEKLIPGDEIILFTEIGEYHYLVQKKYFIPYLGFEADGDAKLQLFSAPQSSEMVTLISCWPYATNSHRIVIIAVSSPSGDQNGD